MPKTKSILAEARAWAIQRKLFGTQAFLRYVMLRFAENLNQVSDDFVFKGGNLLWAYIDTPRATIDLDLSTLQSNSHSEVKKTLTLACAHDSEIHYSLLTFKEVQQDGVSGAAVTIQYETKQGAKNRFEIDIAYAIEADTQEIDSPIHGELKIRAATIENIISDKLSACHRFQSGNTRMKDYDDLWRLSRSERKIRSSVLNTLMSNSAKKPLDPAWIGPELIKSWRSHAKRYNDLPEDLEAVFRGVNQWLKDIL